VGGGDFFPREKVIKQSWVANQPVPLSHSAHISGLAAVCLVEMAYNHGGDEGLCREVDQGTKDTSLQEHHVVGSTVPRTAFSDFQIKLW